MGESEKWSSYQFVGRTGSVLPTASVSVDEIRSAAASSDYYPPSIHAALLTSPEPNPNGIYIHIYFQCMEITSLVSISLFYLSLRFYAVNSIVQSIVVTIYLFIYELHHMISVFWKLNASIIISIMNGNIPSFLGRARSHCLSGRICRRRLWWIYQ